MAFGWAKEYPDLQLICKAFGLYNLDDPIRYSYKSLKGLIQEGPQCGLVALAMCTENTTKEKVAEIFNFAKSKKYTNNGEIFSVDYMAELAEKFLPRNKIEIFEGNLDSEKIVKFLLNKGLMLVPYDCDRNHTPCLRVGHKAHWCVISGIIDTDVEVNVVARHGKSLNVAIWSLEDLARSNEQLVEFSPDRKQSDLVYVLPEGGLGGEKGLLSRSVLVHPSKEVLNS